MTASPRTGRSLTVLAAAVIVLLLWTVVYPNANVILGSFSDGLGHWREFFSNASDREALRESLVISVLSVVAATIIGLPLALLVSRADFPGRGALRVAATLPAALPPLVGVVAFLFLYGESGVVSRSVQAVLGLEAPPWRFTGRWAIVIVHAYAFAPYVFAFVSAGLERLDGSLDEAARGLGAARCHRLRRVTLPQLAPPLLGAMLLVFMSSLGSFSAPYVFGGGLRVLSTQIVTSKLNGAMGLAYVETTMLAVTAIGALLLFRALERGRPVTGGGKGVAPRRAASSPAARALAAIGAASIVLILLLPHLMIVLIAFARNGAWTTQILPAAYTLDNFRSLVQDTALWVPIRNSVTMALIATAANVVVCFAAAYVVVRTRVAGRGVLRLLLALPWAVPATAIAIGLASTFDRNDPAMGRVLLIGTFWILPLAYFIRGIPLVASAVEGSLRQMDPAVEDAARGLGARWWQTFRRVILPAARPGLIAGALLACVNAIGEFVASVVLYTHANRPISIEILAQLRALSFGTAAAFSVLLLALVLIITAIARWLEGRAASLERAPVG
jgi:iron(III) transport system permease protein